MNGLTTRSLAGVVVPESQVIKFARGTSEPYLFNHVMRAWIFAVRLGPLENIAHDAEVSASWGK